MSSATKWSGYYESEPDGRFSITTSSLLSFASKHPDRVLDADLSGRPSKVLLLDVPFQVVEKIADSADRHRLRRIRLIDLPGWPPKLPSSPEMKASPKLQACRVRKAKFVAGSGPGQEGVEIEMEQGGRKFKAWHVGCPTPLLGCVEATLNQAENKGREISELQDVKLAGAG